MDYDLYSVSIDTEEVHRLDYLKAFIHKSCRVYCYLRTHLPGGMCESIREFDILHLFFSVTKERSARRGEQYLFDLALPARFQALEDSRMLTVDRKYLNSALLCARHNYLSRDDQGLLIRKRESCAAVDNCERGHKSCFTDDRVDDGILLLVCDHFAYAALARIDLYIRVGESDAKIGRRALVSHSHRGERELSCLLFNPF